jgi:hypothetical protein
MRLVDSKELPLSIEYGAISIDDGIQDETS